jgi:hypothetical protein
MDLPQYGDVDLSVPTKENLELGRRMAERDAQLKRQQQADRSLLEKVAGTLQTGRLMGSALTQAVNSLPTRIFKGDEAADKFMQERMYQPTQPTAYEYAGDIGDFLEKLETQYKIPPVLPEAMALQYLTGPATAQAARAAGKGAVKAGMELERRMEPVVKGALEQGGLPREMALGMGSNTQSNVIKPKGGNWLAGSVEKVLDPLITKGIIANKEIPYGPEFDSAIIKRIADLKEAASVPNYKGGAGRVASMLEEDLQDAVSTQNRVKNAAINKWVQSNLTNYVKKDMATPDDPVRKLAEEGISHLPTNSPLPLNMGAVKETRKEAGFPEPYGQSWQGLLYESKADKPIGFGTAGEMINRGKGEPWMEKVDPFTKVYGISPMDSVNFTQDIGFNHIIDVLREDLTTGRIRPEQLSKVSMEQAVRRTFEYDQELAKKMDAARLTERADLPVYKEYPEEGYKWVQLTRPGDFAAESNAMGHSVRGYEPPEGHPDWTKGSGEEGSPSYGLGGWEAIKSGKAKVYSLLDSKGEPHVTIEVGANRDQLRKEDLLPYKEAALEEAKLLPNGYTDADVRDIEIRMARENLPPFIRQIKGKGNDRPISKYDPFVQEFVKSGNWNSVNDLQNTGLFKVEEGSTPPGFAEWMRLRALGNEPKVPAGYYTPEELAKYGEESGLKEKYPSVYGSWRKNLGLEPDVPMEPPPPMNGMKAGGKVSISNNPDTMMLELNNKRMKEGGSEDDTKPFFGGAGTKKYAAAKKRAEQGDVNTLRDPKTYATVAGFFGERPDEMGFSVMHPDYQGVREAADPAFYAGTALGVAPLMKVFKAPAMALGRAGEKYAEKVVPQIMERGGVGADILGGLAQGTRSNIYLPHTPQKPDPNVGSRYKTQHVGNLAPKREFDIEANQDSSVMANPWDLTSRGEKVLEVSDTPMINPIVTEGGHDFARDLANIQDTIGGASGRQIAERMQDRVNDAYFANMMDKGSGRVFTMPSTMDYTGSNYSTMPTDVIMDFFKQAELKPKDVNRITDDLRTFMFETERGKFKNAAPVGSPDFMRQLREGGEGFSAGDLRKGFMDRMSKAEYQKMLGYNIEDVYAAIHDPALKGVPKGFVGNTMIETSPFAEIRPSTHQSYDSANAGKYAGSMPSMPIELMMPDLYEYLERQVLSSPKPTYKNMTPNQIRTMIINMIEKRGSVISQPINQRVVDNVMRYKEGLKQGHFKPNDYESIMEFMRRTGGYKDGGTVKKPAGAVKQPAAYIDGSEFVEAAQKYGIKDSMSNLNMIVNLVNKGLSVDDAARQVSDSGMHKAEGGEVSGDDLILEERPL